MSNPQSTNDGAWGDFDRDGWPDLFAADDGGDHLYRNDRDGTFTDVTQQAGVSDADESVSACWGDYDADGRPDLSVVDIGASRNHLYRNGGAGIFTDVTQQTGVGDVGDGRTCDWVDANDDGRLDLFTANHIHLSRLYQQGPDGTFRDVAPAAGMASPFDVFNGAWGDMDADGDLDAFVVGHDGNVLYRNDGPAGGYLQLDLVGSVSNRSAIGAVALLSGPGVRGDRTVEGAGGAYGQDSLTLEFGLGQAAGPFTVKVLWPGGAVQTLTGLTANTHLEVDEPPA